MKVCHVITSLKTGGAQMMLVRILEASRRQGIESAVVVLAREGHLGTRIRELQIPVLSLDLRTRKPRLGAIREMMRAWRRSPPDVVQTWLYHADLIGGLAASHCGLPVAWNVRHSTFDAHSTKTSLRCVVMACARLARLVPSRIVVNSQVGIQVHRALGYPMEKMVFIPNGFDVGNVVPSESARSELRHELGIDQKALLVGNLGRFHAQKDHAGFVQAVIQMAPRHDGVQFVLCGENVVWENRQLAEPIIRSGLRERFHLLGERTDCARIQAGLDVCVSSSAYGEGCPNTIGEAMAAGVPCVVTNVGDAALLVGDTGRVVRARDPSSLAGAMESLLSLPSTERRHLGRKARARIARCFDLGDVVGRYMSLWRELHMRSSVRADRQSRGTAGRERAATERSGRD